MSDTTQYISKINLKGTTYTIKTCAIKDGTETTVISTINSSVPKTLNITEGTHA